MSKIFQNIKIPIDAVLEDKLQYLAPRQKGYTVADYRILKQSVDARQRHSPHFVYSIEVAEDGEILKSEEFHLDRVNSKSEKPIIIGSGPAGLFAALRLVERGIPCHLFERGSESTERIKGINRYWRYGELDLRNNVCYGEGGAGLYSDGKLITRIKSPHIPYVLNRLVQFGAPAEIQWLSNPHVGSDKIRRVIPKMREFLKAHGCEMHFNTQVTKILTNPANQNNYVTGIETEYGEKFESSQVVLAMGHSAEDMIYHLHDIGVHLDGKSFAMGLRVEHSQKAINQIQFRQFADHPKLGSANYKLTYHDVESNIGVYSFCMCPGGFVLSSGTEADGIVCNGMSNYNRNSPFANAAIVISIDHEKTFKDDLFGGMKLRRQLETDSFKKVRALGGTKELPTQNLMNFLNNKNKNNLFRGSSPSGIMPVDFNELLPSFMSEKLKEGLESFEQSMKGFKTAEAQLYGVESRTSCPVRVTRHDDSLESISHAGLFPAGEGAGYAGGITSAACDGIRIAEKIYEKILSQQTQISN